MFRYFNSIREQADPEGPFPAAPAAAPAPSLKVRLDSTLKPHLCQTLKLHLRLRLHMAASVTTLAPCCDYTISSTVHGEYTTGWRLFGGALVLVAQGRPAQQACRWRGRGG